MPQNLGHFPDGRASWGKNSARQAATSLCWWADTQASLALVASRRLESGKQTIESDKMVRAREGCRFDQLPLTTCVGGGGGGGGQSSCPLARSPAPAVSFMVERFVAARVSLAHRHTLLGRRRAGPFNQPADLGRAQQFAAGANRSLECPQGGPNKSPKAIASAHARAQRQISALAPGRAALLRTVPNRIILILSLQSGGSP